MVGFCEVSGGLSEVDIRCCHRECKPDGEDLDVHAGSSGRLDVHVKSEGRW